MVFAEGVHCSLPESGKVIIAGEKPEIRNVLCQWLESEGFDCELSENTGQVLSQLEKNPNIALVIVDRVLPGPPLFEFLLQVKAKYPETAIIAVCDTDSRPEAVTSLRAGMEGYILKPLDRINALVNIANALQRRQLILEHKAFKVEMKEEFDQRAVALRRREEEIALRLVAAAEFRDTDTGAHIRRIGLYSSALANELGWTGMKSDEIRVAGPMHDIGKIGVPDSILQKPGRLSDDEFDVVKTHCDIGARILSGSDVSLLQMAEEIAQSHHEKWDGTGYPKGTAGEDISFPARVVAIVDVYDALASHRVYRPALADEEVITILKSGSDSHFDPNILECFLDILPNYQFIKEQVRDETCGFGSLL